MLRPAILRALAEKDSGAVRVHPHAVGMVRNQVGLARELRNPEAVVGVGGQQLQECRRGMSGIAHRYVQLVGSDDAELGIAELPPELVPDHCYVQGGRRLGSILDGVDHPGRGQKQYDHDQDRNDRPGQFDLRAAIHLGRLAVAIGRAGAELYDGIRQQGKDDDKNQAGDGEDEVRKVLDRIRRSGLRLEDAGHRVVRGRIRGARRHKKKHAGYRGQ